MTGSILVTGAGGCIGAWTLQQLVADNQRVVAFDLSGDTRRAALLMTEDQMQSVQWEQGDICLLYTSPSPRDKRQSRMPSSA